MTGRTSAIAIIGAGLGGLTAAAALRRVGMNVTVYEQAGQFARIGAGIQMSPNAMRVNRALGLEAMLRTAAFRPGAWTNREWDTGEVKFEFPLGDAAEARYGAPYLLLHRGDLHAALASLLPAGCVVLGKQLTDLRQAAGEVSLLFADGTAARADAVVGADGVHSRVRDILLGPGAPRFSGRVAYRAVFSASRLEKPVGDNTKWWGPDRHIVIYYVTPRCDELYFVTSVPEPEWRRESWSATGDVETLRAAFAGFHPDVRRVLAACPQAHKWAILEREPLPAWSDGRVVLIGDACHPMTPYMAQGAAMAMEDAAVLSRCLAGVDADGIAEAFGRFEQSRKERASRVQLGSHQNRFMSGQTDPDWLYGYDAWQAPLADANTPAVVASPR